MTIFSAVRPSPRQLRRQRQDGYVLLTLVLAIALMGIFALAVAVPVKFDLQRDQEEELIHRGVQYSRAIRSYYKKFGRYPTRLEDLDNTNNLRYLRKHYKDAINKNRDFKLLHYGDPGVTLTGSVGSTPIAGANTVGQMNASGSGNSAFGGGSGSSGFGGGSSGFGNSNSSFGNSSGGFGGNSNSAFGGNSNSGFGASSNSQPSSASQGTNATAGSDPSTQTVSQTPGTAPGDASASTQQVFGGGPIVGVASASKDTTIREFNHKRKYSEWQFVYDPTTDRGGLLMTPNQPSLQVATQPQNGQPGSTNSNGNSFGQATGFGNNSQGLSGGSTIPSPPPANPQPQ